jgi:16S rRNA (cytosine1402-N4)-methyltransferase
MTAFAHVTVLAAEAVSALSPRDGGLYVDCTLGGGGHAEGLLNAANCRVIGLDRDPNALAAARLRLAPFGERFQAVHARFSELRSVLDGLGVDAVDGVLADLGVSSPQLDQAERGFSFRFSGPLDMRMDPTGGVTAADLVNTAEPTALADWIFAYGEERAARRVARAIVEGRPWSDTATLAAAIADVVGRGSGIHPATRTFQALRIVVNDELGEIRRLLPTAVDVLRPEGRLAIIAFHSLEDRIVKHYFHEQSGRTAPRDPFGNPVGPLRLRVLPPVAPSPTDPNPRARSARLRAAVRLPWNAS